MLARAGGAQPSGVCCGVSGEHSACEAQRCPGGWSAAGTWLACLDLPCAVPVLWHAEGTQRLLTIIVPPSAPQQAIMLHYASLPPSSLSRTPAAPQDDGALAASAGMDGIARVWDCRTGRNIFTCQGHVKAVLSLDFSPSGVLLATGSEDNTARVWDLRKRGVLAILPGEPELGRRVARCAAGGGKAGGGGKGAFGVSFLVSGLPAHLPGA